MPPPKTQKNKKAKQPKRIKSQYSRLSKITNSSQKYSISEVRRDTQLSLTSKDVPSEEHKRDVKSLWKKGVQRAYLTGSVVKVFKQLTKQAVLFGTSKRTSTITPAGLESHFDTMNSRSLNPNGRMMKVWNWVIGSILLYISLILPYRVAFQIHTHLAWMVFDLVLSIALAVDIVFTLCQGSFNYESGEKVTHKVQYLKGWFVIDLLAALPFQLLNLTSGEMNDFLRPLRLIRVIKLTRIIKYAALIRGYTQRRRFKFCKLEDGIKRILFITGLALLLTHLVACLWYLLARLYKFNEETWVFKRNINKHSSPYRYLVAFYWSVQTVTTVGFGDVGTASVAQMILSVLWMFLGVGFYSFVMGNVSSMMAQIDSKKAKLRSRLGALDKFAQTQHIPETLYIRIKLHIEQNFSRKELRTEKQDLLESLPRALKVELMNYTHGKIISSLSFFESKSWNFVWMTVPLLKQVNFARYEIIYREGDISNQCYFLLKGQVAFSTPEGVPFRKLMQGMTFGDISLLAKEPHNQTAITVAYCELQTLTKADFHRILSEFPKDANDVIIECNRKREYLEEGRAIAEANQSLKPIFKELLQLRSSWLKGESFNSLQLQFSPRKSILSDKGETSRSPRKESLSERGETTQFQLTTTAPSQQKEKQREKLEINKWKGNSESLSSRLQRAWETERVYQEEEEEENKSEDNTPQASNILASLKAEGKATQSIRELIQKIEESASMLAGVMETVCREEGIIKRTVAQTSSRIDDLRKDQLQMKE